jgi:hypothetical protein
LRERGNEWFDVSYRMLAKERSVPTPGAAVMISRILDLMYIQILRVWASSIDNAPGWLRAGVDPHIGRVVAHGSGGADEPDRVPPSQSRPSERYDHDLPFEKAPRVLGC